jgi:hypothetical protein
VFGESLNENEELITVLYSRILNRAPSEKEFRHWVGVLESGKSPAAVATAFYNSREYQAKNQESGRGRLVQRYLNLLEASLTGMLFEDAPCDY